jgi:hypothetical protein
MQKELDFKAEVEKVFGRCFVTEEERESELGSAIALSIEKGHAIKKEACGHRLQILRVLIIRHHFKKRESMNEWDFLKRCEKYLDNLLAKNDYQLEILINDWRNKVDLTIETEYCNTCCYQPLFCCCAND